MSNVPKLRFREFEEEWSVVSLESLLQSISYGMNAASKLYDGENRYIRITDIDEETRQYIDENKVSPDGELSNKFLLNEDDLLFARTGASTGKSFIYKNEYGKMYYAGFLIRARLKEDINPYFVYLQTLNSSYYNWVRVMSMRSGQPGINAEEYKKLQISITSKLEQDKIANFLEILERKILRQQEKIELLKEQKKGYMQKIFNRELRFKDKEGKEFTNWKKYTLYDVVDRVVRKNKGLQSDKILTISAQNGLIDQTEYFNKTVASKNLEGYYLLKRNEFAYNKSYSNGYPLGVIKRLKRYEHGVLSSLYICFKNNNKYCNTDFLEYYFESSMWHKEVAKISVEGARNHGLLNISIEDFFNTKHLLPSIEEQEAIASFFNILNERLNFEMEKVKLLENEKRYFMQQMFI